MAVSANEQISADYEENSHMIMQKKVLNYHEFLSKTAKFKKIVDFGPPIKKESNLKTQDKTTPKDGLIINSLENSINSEDEGETMIPAGGIEERIHINYRLQFLRDSVMARYIDD